jgi:hypothetical protein
MGWLDSVDSGPWQLARWLQGYDLPALGGGDEPYVSLLYALPVGGDRHPYETRLAERAASLINDEPDVHRPGDMPERLIYNLLSLCSGLHAPDLLADPLYAMHERRALRGQWMGVELCDALLSALVPNQADNRLWGVWRRMLGGRETESLRGNEYDGFEGVLWMPASRQTDGEPDLKALGYALWMMSRRLNEHPHNRLEFSSLLERVQAVYFDHETWGIDLLRLANEFEWPKWAVDCLPDLPHIVGDVEPDLCHAGRESEHDCKRVIMWWPYVELAKAGAAIADFWYKTEKTFCEGQVSQLILPQKEMEFVTGLAPHLEPKRDKNPYPSQSSVVGIIADALSDYKFALGRDDEGSRILKRAHKGIREKRST